MGIRADERVRIEHTVFSEHTFGEVFEVDLVDNPDARHDLEGIKGLFSPFEELITLAVAVELKIQVAGEGFAGAGIIDLHRVLIDNEITGTKGSIIFGSLPIAATADRIAARSTSKGTPVKSCNTMRATTNGIS